MRLVEINQNVSLYLPESFEWLILKSGLIADKHISEMLAHPQDEIESSEYFSWERYFTAQLVQNTQESYLKYAKNRLNPVYLQEKNARQILSVMKNIELTSDS